MRHNVSRLKKRAYAAVRRIPAGKVASYGQIAALAGNSKAARAVGTLLKYNEDPKRIPCHRVVASDGALSGYAFGNGIPAKRKLLLREGVVFRGAHVNMERSQWKS